MVGEPKKPISYSIREDAKANTFSVTEDDVALCVTKVRPSPQSHHAQNFIVQPNQNPQGVDLYNQSLTGDLHCPLRTNGHGHGAPAVAVAFQPGNLARRAGSDPSTEVFPTLSKDSGDQNPHVATPMAVRRLTPNECLALQGFPKDWTKISWKGKPPEECPDGPQYKAAGNSMAVPCMRWIGERIMLVEQVLSEVGNNK